MKDAYYFSHDSNARHDPKITAMRGVYGSEGYGWYWMLIEMMRESNDYKLDMHSKYTFNAFALQLQSDSKRIEEFVHDCINEFNLFLSDEKYFWSESLVRRMQFKDEKSEKRRQAANARWEKERKSKENSKDNANGMQMHDADNANAMQGKESKVNQSKEKENKEDHTTTTADIVHFWENNGFGTVSSHLSQEISGWIDENTFDEPEDIIILAMKEAIEANARTWSYVNTILVSWSNLKLKKEKDVVAHLQGFKNRKANSNNRTGGRNRERCEVDKQANFGNAF